MPTSILLAVIALLAPAQPPGSAPANALATPAPVASANAAATLEDYVVQSGDTCAKIARERFGETRRVDLIHKHNALGPTPHHLRPGTILHLPAPAGTGGPDAELTFLRNRVETFTPDRKQASLNEKLSRGHRVGTEEKSAAEVTFADSGRMELGENTLIVILGHARAMRDSGTGTLPETTLVTGALRANLGALAGGEPSAAAPRPAFARVRTDAGEVELGNGETKVSVDPAKKTRLAVYRGRSSLRAAKKTVEVPEGYGSGVKLGEAPTAPQKLPAAPVWTTEPPEKLASTVPADLKAAYAGGSEGPAPASFRMQFARDPSFHDLVVDTLVEAQVKTFEARGLEAAIYYARVSAIDADEFEGPFGKVIATTVTVTPAPPTVAPPPRPAAVVPSAPVPPPQPRWHRAVGVLGGVGVTASHAIFGPRLAVEVEGAFDVEPRLSLALGVRGGFEDTDGVTTTGGGGGTARRLVFGGGLLASVRYRLDRALGLTPYLGVLAELSFVKIDYGDGGWLHDWFPSLGPVVGLALPLGRGALALEGLWRTPTTYSARNPNDTPIAAFGLLSGYRLRF